MNVINMKRNFNNATIISENDFNELLSCNDEDKFFDSFLIYYEKIIKEINNRSFNVIDVKRLFSLNLKLFDFIMNSDDINDSDDELINVYNDTKYIVDNIESEIYDEDMMNNSIKNVSNFWNNKLEEQKKLGETINKTVDILDDGLKKINNSLKLKEISNFGINNMENKTNQTSSKASEYLIILNEMLASYPTEIIEKVNKNVKNDSKYYSKNENKTKDNIDELTINNIIKCSMLMMLLK